MTRPTLLFLALLAGLFARGQNPFGITPQRSDQPGACTHFEAAFAQKPREIQFRAVADAQNTLYFEVSDPAWFNSLFPTDDFGISVDLVTKDRYACEQNPPEPSFPRGQVLRPVYGDQLRRTLKPAAGESYRVRIGKVPDGYRGMEVEYNLLFLRGSTLCRYQSFFELQAYSWDLLDMGMYLDSLTYRTQLSALEDTDRFTLRYKTLTFTVPFEKNKAEYAPEDLRPLYDSLRLTDFNIRRIDIRAYASVEGDAGRNLELQNQRAQSMVRALQSFQQPSIETSVSTAENWVEFLEDLKNTEYANLRPLPQAEIKAALNGGAAARLEPILSRHRKAVVTLELERKDRYRDQTVAQLVTLFNQAIGEDALEKASELQASIFERLKSGEAPVETLSDLEMPRQQKYVPFFNKNSAFRYLMDERNMLIAFNELESLDHLTPEDPKIQYNLAALKLKLWRYNAQPIADGEVKKNIEALRRLGIAENLVQRMLINYHIVRSEYLMRQRDYAGKDASVQYIAEHYTQAPLRDYDYLSLAQYMAYYANLEEAVTLVEPRMRRIEVSENLLFYYLNLTLVDRSLTQDPDYRTIMLNAIGKNPERFCRLFNPIPNGGVTFQLLENPYLRETYCENCTSPKP
ncbi:hypothetical protein OZ410_12495 [Robiginitalea sp. M366]|uniref:hypothetical protein n=1 Tax=Robiginitalea aestuariiviva TaxID=3036903 RepID=UPI00240DD03D|nr:hypothetical protein [Robiginitalea aestuariiviva]MDG1573141.1 hypothetical protein [Robiginitalea aestuariiviva]